MTDTRTCEIKNIDMMIFSKVIQAYKLQEKHEYLSSEKQEQFSTNIYIYIREELLGS